MSRIGKMPVKVQPGVKVEITKDGLVKVEGPKGKLSHKMPTVVVAKLEGGQVTVSLDGKAGGKGPALFGLSRTMVANMVHGVNTGFSRELEIIGVGYRAATKGNLLTLTVGYSHPIDYEMPAGVSVKVDNNTKVTVAGADKMIVGMVAAKIRSFREPEPYQGKGIRYAGEHIVRKQGKSAGAK